jgi:hypothetical protein
MRVFVAVALCALDSITLAQAEDVYVKYRHANPVDLKHFACTSTDRSSFVRRVCYDRANSYMLIKLRETWYHYCGIPADVVASLIAVGSVGTYFNRYVKGKFDCRINPVPSY